MNQLEVRANMKEELNTLKCERESELIGFLYGELNEFESRTFARHLSECAACSAELSAFKNIRESVIAWRDESLGGALFAAAATASRAAEVGERRSASSALGALREFFNLSPLWMKGALAFASVLFCLFAGLAIAVLRTTSPASVAVNANNPAPSEQQINALVQRRVQDELERIQNSNRQEKNVTVVARNAAPRNLGPRVAKRSSELAGNVTAQKARRPLSRIEREQLAADLRLISAKNDSELDLLDDRINQ